MSHPEDPKPPAQNARPPARAPYEKPALAWEEKLEARPSLMAACGQKPMGGGDCDTEAWS